MIKSTTHVVVLVALSFGVMIAGVNPSVRADVESTIRSTGASLFATFSGSANKPGTSAATGFEVNSLIYSVLEQITAITRPSTDANANNHLKSTIKTDADAAAPATNSGNATSLTAQASADTGVFPLLSLATLLQRQFYTVFGVYK